MAGTEKRKLEDSNESEEQGDSFDSGDYLSKKMKIEGCSSENADKFGDNLRIAVEERKIYPAIRSQVVDLVAVKLNNTYLKMSNAGIEASLSLKANRVPIHYSAVEGLISQAIKDHGSFNRKVCFDLLKTVSNTVVILMRGLSMDDYLSEESSYPLIEKFDYKLEMHPNNTIIDDLNIFLLRAERNELSKKYIYTGNGAKYPVFNLKSIFPIADKPTSTVVRNNDKFSRTRLLLSVAQLKEDGFPIPSCDSSYVKTKDVYEHATDNSPMFGLDCEMCQTLVGSELTKVSIVDENYKVIYDKYVLPYNKIIDYKTQYSGITEKTLQGVSTRLFDVQKDLRGILPSNAILVGQSLNFDLHALKMIHPYVIDTSVIYKTGYKPSYKTKLRDLASRFLKKSIQSGRHDSVEDAKTALELVRLKLNENFYFGNTIINGRITHFYTSNKFLVVCGRNILDNYKSNSKSFDQDVVKVVEFDEDESIIECVSNSCENYNLTLANVNMDNMKPNYRNVAVNALMKNIWPNVPSTSLVIVIFPGKEKLNGSVFVTMKK